MKHFIRVFLILNLVLLVGCGAMQMAKTREEVLNDPQLPSTIKQAIIDKKIMVGMTKKQVIASWGNPCSYCYGTRQTSHGDYWEYNIFGTGRYSAGAGTYLFFDAKDRLQYWSK